MMPSPFCFSETDSAEAQTFRLGTPRDVAVDDEAVLTLKAEVLDHESVTIKEEEEEEEEQKSEPHEEPVVSDESESLFSEDSDDDRTWEPEKTSEKFTGDWMRTGDLGTCDSDGYFE